MKQTDQTQTAGNLETENKEHPIKVNVTNYQAKTLNVKKVDRTYATHVLPGAVFRLTNSAGYTRDVTTDENGIASFGDLLLGSYSLTEIKAPAGYRLDNTVYPIALSSAETPTAITVNKEIADDPYQVNLTKYDNRVKKDDPVSQKKYLLPNAVYKLVDVAANKTLKADMKTNADGQLTFGAASSFDSPLKDGEYAIEGLKPDTSYRLVETEAPEHYEGDAADQVNATSGTQKQAETIKDDHFPDRQPMTGAEFKLYRYDEAGKVDRSRSWDATITNNDGTVSFKDSDLYEGKYQLVETKAPDGYVIPDELARALTLISLAIKP